MFREMRRKDKQASQEESIEILKKGEFGVLSTICENGYPCGIPLNYVYFNGRIYFHCAKEGQKLDNIKNNPKVSFCVACDVELLPEKFSTKYSSAVLFGTAEEVNGEEKTEALLELIKKYSARFIEQGKEYIKKSSDTAKVYKINIEHITGKSQRQLKREG